MICGLCEIPEIARNRVHFLECGAVTAPAPCPSFTGDSGPEPPSEFAAVTALATPEARFRPSHSKMHGFAARTFRLPIRSFFEAHRYDGLESGVAFELENERRAGFAPASVSAQCLRALVAMIGLRAFRTGRLPVARRHHRVVRIVAGTRFRTQSTCNRLPCRAMMSRGTGDGVSDLMQQCVENLFVGTVLGVILSDLDSLRSVLANS